MQLLYSFKHLQALQKYYILSKYTFLTTISSGRYQYKGIRPLCQCLSEDFPLFIFLPATARIAKLLLLLSLSRYLPFSCYLERIPLLLTASTASLIVSTGRVRAKRTCPFPSSPKLLPGVHSTPVFSISSMTNAVSSSKPSGTGAQANMVPSLSGTFQPMERKPPHRASLLFLYSSHWRSTGSSGRSALQWLRTAQAGRFRSRSGNAAF